MDETFITYNPTHPKTGEEFTLLVGSLGTIIRPSYRDRRGCERKSRVLKGGSNSTGREQVNLWAYDSEGKKHQWHTKRYQLVAAAWHGYEFGSGHHVHHIDCDETNNEADNLVPLTPKEHKRVHILIKHYGFDPYEALAEVLMARGDDDRDDLATEAVA
jgi:hypothetical protein